MNQMEIFKNPEFGSIRVIEEDGKYLFSGLDVANALGYSNSRASISRHCRYRHETRRTTPAKPGADHSDDFHPRRRRLPSHRPQPSAFGGAV